MIQVSSLCSIPNNFSLFPNRAERQQVFNLRVHVLEIRGEGECVIVLLMHTVRLTEHIGDG
jgi:hypothetical protein